MADGLPVCLVLVGTNHRHAPIGVRERLAARDHGTELVEDLMLHDAVAEAAGGRLGGLGPARVAVVGAGRVAELTIASLVARGAREIVVVGRSQAAARELAERFGGRAAPWRALAESVAAADVVLSST